jgi:hypothetical protein
MLLCEVGDRALKGFDRPVYFFRSVTVGAPEPADPEHPNLPEVSTAPQVQESVFQAKNQKETHGPEPVGERIFTNAHPLDDRQRSGFLLEHGLGRISPPGPLPYSAVDSLPLF